jgi:hypothetical protein
MIVFDEIIRTREETFLGWCVEENHEKSHDISVPAKIQPRHLNTR